MFNKFMNNYYYGKSGKADFTPDDMPETRMQLFLEVLRTRFSQLMRLNLIYLLIWLPTLLVLSFGLIGSLNVLTSIDPETAVVSEDGTPVEASGEVITTTTKDGQEIVIEHIFTYEEGAKHLQSLLFWTLVLLFPCIAITGPFSAGVSYVTRNWARDEHAFIWSDMKDAMKQNWKQSLPISVITGALPMIVYMSWTFYGNMAATRPLMVVPQVLVLMITLVWAFSVTYMYPLIVTYELKMRDVIRNSLLLAIARLPMSVGIRLLHCVPALLFIGLSFVLGFIQWGIMLMFLYYVLLGLALSRFVTASYTNAVFDRFINPKIEGAKVNRGLKEMDDEDDDEDEEDEEDQEQE